MCEVDSIEIIAAAERECDDLGMDAIEAGVAIAFTMEAVEKGLSKKIKEKINHADRKHFHVVLVKVTDRPGQVKNKVSVSVQMFAKHGWEKIQKNFQFLGFNKIALLHDPTLLDEKEEVVIPTHARQAATIAATKEVNAEMDAEIEKRVEARLKARQDALDKEAKAKADAAKEAAKAKEAPAKELTEDEKVEELQNDYAKAMAGNKPELEAFLNKYGISSGDLTNNEGRKQRITKWFESEMAKNDSEEVEETTDDTATDGGGEGSEA